MPINRDAGVGGGCPAADEIGVALDGGTSPAALAALHVHMAACGSCRALVSALARIDTPAADAHSASTTDHGAELAPGSIVDRFTVFGRLGAGGMGQIYAARDPALDRNVALKLLRTDRLDPDERAAMQDHQLREARAMAKLAHPNVVAVYELGRFGDQIFIAMELVEGQTLTDWLAEAPRGWREIVAAFRAAGQGLAAAHAAGLVHRDFKPDNVLVGRDRRIRVTDFGLAHAAQSPPVSAGEATLPSPYVTVTGALVGTPFYLAPEQYRGEPADPRSDQFSFCIALYHALHGEHPFIGADLAGFAELPRRVLTGRLAPPPPGASAPAWLGRIVRRGLSAEPAHRYPSMTELLAALGRSTTARLQRGVTVAAIIAAVLVVPLVDVARDPGSPCGAVATELTGLWGPTIRAGVQRAFAATGKPFASAAFAETRRVLDGYLATLSEMTAATCSAGSRRAGHDELVEQRTMCLEARAISVRATIDVLGSADATAVERAPSAVHALPELASCADPLALLGPAAPPSDPAARARIRDLRVELARTQSLYDAGRDTPSLDQARALAGRARQAGYRPLEAEALFLVGRIADDRAETASAEAALGQAVLAADAGRSDELAARALVRLIRLRGKPGPDALEQSQQLAARVTAILERIGGSPEVEGLLHVAISQVRYGAGRYEEAEGEARRGLGLLEHRFGPTDLRVADAVEQLARIAIVRVQPDLALTLTRRVLAIRLAILGGDHPAVATANTGVALALVAVRRYGEAARAFETALAIRERALGRDHPDVGAVLANMTLNDLWQADYDAALVHIRRAVAIAERAYGRRHPIYGRWRCREAGVLIELGHHRDALPVTRDGLAALVATIGSEQLDTAYCRRYLASVLHELGRDREARREALDSLAVQDRLLGSGQPYLSETLRLLGKIDLAAHQSARAVATLERARTLAAPLDAAVRAQLDFDLAQALGDTDRARSLARAARTIAAQDPRLGDDLRAIDAWLARHRLM